MKYLLIDTNFLCHRAFHSTGGLTYKDDPTGVIYGVLRAVIDLHYQFSPDRMVFAFDSGESLRRDIYPKYKISRRRKKRLFNRREKREYKGMLSQVEKLRREILPEVGFRNIHAQLGYEADDVIAKIAMDLNVKHEVIIVSCDHDLYQCLAGNVTIWNIITHQMFDVSAFKKKYGVHPVQWCLIKAMAGCSSDDVIGIPGVGEKTAAKWCAGKVKEGSSIHKKILANHQLMKTNSELVILPFRGIKRFKLRDDEVKAKKWNRVMNEYGLRTLRNEAPVNG